ncbi:PREDICTED: dehydrogenase/reductase SDR family member 1-like [Branchiostoma belcheri]|uniref:Dehydrogenase/reductase SDR family member 1-like n=1 Tax=Branchiostoma belcheri TaxID=7741 RepID=A0A6P4ZJH4_BRABE|nr:PREDICTED: dehydrogenase/reductase SDR family member 1-like [Branchiostoma belcheri]
MSQPLSGRIAVVTGASRGIGKGIALQLGEAGATVYITGRTMQPDGRGTSLMECAEEIEKRGGKCIPVQCDHEKDEDIKKLFEKVKQEQNGQLDILVNNAYKAVGALTDSAAGKKFYLLPPEFWDDVNNVGLRNHYICSVYAARLMAPQKKGLIVNISSFGGLGHAIQSVYSVGKAACDRMATDCAVELRKDNVAFVSLWPGAVRTENILDMLKKGPKEDPERDQDTLGGVKMDREAVKRMFEMGETPEFAGKAVVHLAADPNIMQRSGKIQCTAELAEVYGFKDIDGRQPPNFRRIKDALSMFGYTRLAAWIPSFIKIPYWLLVVATHKF